MKTKCSWYHAATEIHSCVCSHIGGELRTALGAHTSKSSQRSNKQWDFSPLIKVWLFSKCPHNPKLLFYTKVLKHWIISSFSPAFFKVKFRTAGKLLSQDAEKSWLCTCLIVFYFHSSTVVAGNQCLGFPVDLRPRCFTTSWLIHYSERCEATE